MSIALYIFISVSSQKQGAAYWHIHMLFRFQDDVIDGPRLQETAPSNMLSTSKVPA
jgi:hypothetical protein